MNHVYCNLFIVAFKKMISSPSWNVDLSGQDGRVGVIPKMRPLDTDTSSLEDWEEPSNFPTNGEYEYQKARVNYFK